MLPLPDLTGVYWVVLLSGAVFLLVLRRISRQRRRRDAEAPAKPASDGGNAWTSISIRPRGPHQGIR